jgi:hypothetical protein
MSKWNVVLEFDDDDRLVKTDIFDYAVATLLVRNAEWMREHIIDVYEVEERKINHEC